MKNIFVAFMAIMILAGCSKGKQYTSDLTGSWTIYKLTYNGVDVSNYLNDSFINYNITYSANGSYLEQYVHVTDTVAHFGKWQFENSYSQLLLTDTANRQDTFTIFNLTGNSVELRADGYDRYMRKLQ